MTDLCDFPAKPGARTRIFLRGKTIRTGKNLAAILIHARENPVDVVELRDLGSGNYGVAFHFDDRAEAPTTWSDWRVVCSWLVARRSWSINRVNIDPSLFEGASPLLDPLRKRGTFVHQRRPAA